MFLFQVTPVEQPAPFSGDFLWLWAFYFAFMLFGIWPVLRRCTHIFQLSSYQNLSYYRFFRESGEFFRLERISSLVLLLASAFCLFWRPFLCALLAFAAVCGLFFLDRHPKAKKPLKYTKRALRLIAADLLLSLMLFTGLGLILAAGDAAMLMGASAAIVIFVQPWILIAAGGLTAPLEKAISWRYVREAEQLLRENRRLTIIGITGSYGKTSVKYFLSELLSSKYHVFMTPGNFNTTLGVTRAIREGLLPTHNVFLCEMGARHPGDIREICDFVHPNMGVITAVAPQHLETFGSLEAILGAKLELYRAVRERGKTFINLDSPPLRQASITQNVISYGLNDQPDYQAMDLTVDENGSAFTITAPNGESARFTTRLLGRANVQNILAAVAVSHYMGIPFDDLVPKVRALTGAPHRLELRRHGGFTLIDDAYNSNPDGAQVALETLSLFKGVRIVITPGLVELGAEEEARNQELGAYAAGKCDYALLVGRRRAAPIRRGLLEGQMAEERIFVFDTVEQALAFAASVGGEQKTVLLLNDLPDNY